VTGTGQRQESDVDDLDLASIARALHEAGAVFAYLHGSQAVGTAKPGSDVDVAAWFGRPVDAWVVAGGLPADVDLLVLDGAPLELAGRVAQHARLLFEVDPAARVRWEATTRKIYLDEQPRLEQARRDFVEAQLRG
jgi:predicted nucleotidyltransferase